MNEDFSTNCPGSLFWQGSLLELMQEQNGHLCAEIDGYSREQLLQANLEELADSLADKYSLQPVHLHRDKTTIAEHGQTVISNEKRTCLVVYDPRLSRQSAATFYRFAVPFDGDGRLFARRPSDYEMELPWGEVAGNELHILCKTTSRDRDTIRSKVDDNLNLIERWLYRANKEVEPFNASLKRLALDRLQGRKNKFQQDNALVESLGFPLRERGGAPETFKVPVTRAELPVAVASPPTQLQSHDPYLDDAAYEGILKTIYSMARVLELSPKAFAKMDEEALRFVLLVPLNIHYQGQATGETFNSEGKTDIIIKVGDRNIFIAECLVWDGPEYFRSKIDQLLGYASLRDTKTAILVFNRNKNLSVVLSQIPAVVHRHPNCKRQDSAFRHESGCRFVLHHRDDKDRELVLTVLVFDVPR